MHIFPQPMMSWLRLSLAGWRQQQWRLSASRSEAAECDVSHQHLCSISAPPHRRLSVSDDIVCSRASLVLVYFYASAIYRPGISTAVFSLDLHWHTRCWRQIHQSGKRFSKLFWVGLCRKLWKSDWPSHNRPASSLSTRPKTSFYSPALTHSEASLCFMIDVLYLFDVCLF